jgi:hypothetical protein
LVAQQLALARHFPDAHAQIDRSVLTWRGKLHPTPLSSHYMVRVDYKLGSSPDVRVVHPTLACRDGESPPHLYPDGCLCLFLPRAYEWQPHMLIATTTVPWTSEWLFYYEIWVATGTWCGGGAHH